MYKKAWHNVWYLIKTQMKLAISLLLLIHSHFPNEYLLMSTLLQVLCLYNRHRTIQQGLATVPAQEELTVH